MRVKDSFCCCFGTDFLKCMTGLCYLITSYCYTKMVLLAKGSMQWLKIKSMFQMLPVAQETGDVLEVLVCRKWNHLVAFLGGEGELPIIFTGSK